MSAGWPDARPEGSARPESRRGAKAIVAALVIVVLIVFVIRNSQRVSVDFILTKGHFRLIWVIVICSILGGVAGYALGRPPRRGKGKRQRSGGSPGDGDLPSL